MKCLIRSNLNCQELDNPCHPGWYRTACMKCLRALSNARTIMPSSIFLRNVTREGENPVAGGGYAVSPLCSWFIILFPRIASLQDIWKGRLHDKQVCLKVLRVFYPEGDQAKVLRVSREHTERNYLLNDLLQELCQEALIWRQLRHPNVIRFLGVSKELFAPRYCLISPWMVNGNIMSYLEAHPDHDRLASVC